MMADIIHQIWQGLQKAASKLAHLSGHAQSAMASTRLGADSAAEPFRHQGEISQAVE